MKKREKKKNMKISKSLSEIIIKKSFDLSVALIEKFNDISNCENKVQDLRKLQNGTIGKEIANCLDENKLNLIPNFESHDLKHILLDFKMTPIDEIRMQAFMLGNGNYTFPCFAILTFGALLLPNYWKKLYEDYKRGKNTKPISDWNIENYAEKNLLETREMMNLENTIELNIFTMKNLLKYGAFSLIILGIFGMIFCLPFLFSSSIADLIGAGFPFVAGAILTIGGFIVLSNQSKDEMKMNYSTNEIV